ncbi:MAG: DUF4125 family protein [Lachnospiraceae bacterium]|nr:DUF4125 family protein [Lachnospiraceae bacterium]
MNIELFFREVDRLFDENKAKEAEALMLQTLEEAQERGEHGVCLQILNELIGYYRQTSEMDKLTNTIEASLQTARDLGLEGTTMYGTTALNAANGYRSMGNLQESRRYYDQAEEIYDRELETDDMLLAGLYNNRSLLEQEVGDYQKAEEYLLKALQIVEANQSGFEIAVTYANLANTAVLGKEFDRARDYAKRAIYCFQKRNLYDAHYCAALSALGLCHYHAGEFEDACRLFEEGMTIVESTLGHNTQYERLKMNRDACLKKMGHQAAEQPKVTATVNDQKEEPKGQWSELTGLLQEQMEKQGVSVSKAEEEKKPWISGLELSKKYFETYGKPMLEKEFPEYIDKIAAGLVGEGSDCMGFDDEASVDHDWGPGFCMWIPKDLEPVIGEKLRECYEALPTEFLGYKRVSTTQGKGRVGVWTIEDFYGKYAGMDEQGNFNWRGLDDVSFLAATDGEVFHDPKGDFTKIRSELKEYPEEIRFLKLAEDCAKISQTGQYNYFRMLDRGDRLTADAMLMECIRHIMRFWHHLCKAYAPHDKWLKKSMKKLWQGEETLMVLEQLHATLSMDDASARATVEALLENHCQFIAKMMYDESLISDIDPYLDHQVEELVMKAGYATLETDKLVRKIARTEFEAFDKVKNEGGRASCQNDWPTFSVMRKSQYMTWDREMLMQYLYDFEREMKLGHNLITEKYGRMMESTAPEKYAELEKHFPELSEEKKAVIEQIVALQMNMVEEVAKEYPKVVANARTLHTAEDEAYDTSYETYLRGEISTYSDKMLQLYAGYVIEWMRSGKNIARATMENTAKLYGYQSLQEFENSI